MPRLLMPALLALAGCATPAAPPPVQMAGVIADSDPALMEIFFGRGQHRTISPIIRCPIKCRGAQ